MPKEVQESKKVGKHFRGLLSIRSSLLREGFLGTGLYTALLKASVTYQFAIDGLTMSKMKAAIKGNTPVN